MLLQRFTQLVLSKLRVRARRTKAPTCFILSSRTIICIMPASYSRPLCRAQHDISVCRGTRPHWRLSRSSAIRRRARYVANICTCLCQQDQPRATMVETAWSCALSGLTIAGSPTLRPFPAALLARSLASITGPTMWRPRHHAARRRRAPHIAPSPWHAFSLRRPQRQCAHPISAVAFEDATSIRSS